MLKIDYAVIILVFIVLSRGNRVIFYPEKIFEFWGIGEVMDFEGVGGVGEPLVTAARGYPKAKNTVL